MRWKTRLWNVEVWVVAIFFRLLYKYRPQTFSFKFLMKNCMDGNSRLFEKQRFLHIAINRFSLRILKGAWIFWVQLQCSSTLRRIIRLILISDSRTVGYSGSFNQEKTSVTWFSEQKKISIDQCAYTRQ